MKTTFSILFFIKKNQPKRNGLCTIMVHITINNESVQFSTQTEVSPFLWNQSLGMVEGRSKIVRDINEKLSFIRSQLINYYRELSKENHYIHPIKLKNAYLVKKEERLLSYQFEHQLKNLHLKSGNSLSKELFARYRLTWKRIKEFIEMEYKTSDIYIDKIDLDFLNRCYLFLRQQYGYNNNTAMKYMQRFSTIMKFAEKTGIIYPNPFELYHFHLDKFNPTVLSEDEINRIWGIRS
ncbi:MAG: phage integrase SAM-like domain-containing protein [Clostridium sp.]|nr:phage integrase SAM-like domain-containing protein [Clostridium sp.]